LTFKYNKSVSTLKSVPLRSKLGANKGPDILPTPVPIGEPGAGVPSGDELKGENPNIYYLFEIV
jgi:hypothetical protein